MYTCRKDGLQFKNNKEFSEHVWAAHRRKKLVQPKRFPREAELKPVEYSFFNSPKELVLDLGEYKISITKK